MIVPNIFAISPWIILVRSIKTSHPVQMACHLIPVTAWEGVSGICFALNLSVI
jgi:hypothetical protein